MKKIINAVICLIIILSSAIVLGGCAKSSYIYMNAETYCVGDGTIDDLKISTIDIDWLAGSVELEVSSDIEKVSISESYKKTLKDDQKLRYKLSNGTLSVKYRNSSTTKVDVGLEKTLVVKIPASVEGLTKIVAKSSTASIKVNGNFKNAVCSPLTEINLQSASGLITLGGFNATKLFAKSVNGNVIVKTCQISAVNIETTSGGIYTQDIIGSTMVVKTVSGASKIKCNSAVSSVSVKSSSGAVELLLPQSIVGYEVNFKTLSGKYSSEFAEKTIDNKKVYGTGVSSSITIETVSGGFAIKKNDNA